MIKYNQMITKEYKPLVYIIILNYNDYNDTVECINSLKNISYSNINIILIDNHSTDNSGTKLKKLYPEYHFIQTNKNLGYAGGNNLGIKHAMENFADYICIMNNDVVVEKDFLEPIIHIMEGNPVIGIAGPKICEYNNKTVIQSTGSKINLISGKVPPINAGRKSFEFTDTLDVDYIGGACIIIKKDIIQKTGLIPEEYFLFFEETEWCLKARQQKIKVVCVCKSCVYHKGSNTIKKYKGIQAYYMMKNNFVFEKRNATILQLTIFILYKILRYSLTFTKGILMGTLDKDLFHGFIDGLRFVLKSPK